MNLVEVSHPRKRQSMRQNENRDFPANPPWEIGFSELPDRNLVLSVSQYRDVNLSNGKEALFGLFDGGDGNPAPKYISKSIAKIYAEEKNIEETHGFSLKYTLLNAMKCEGFIYFYFISFIKYHFLLDQSDSRDIQDRFKGFCAYCLHTRITCSQENLPSTLIWPWLVA
jgi:hypothetical protein